MKSIRILSVFLAIAGCFWAFLGYMGIAALFASAAATLKGESMSLVFLYLGLQALFGFFIWSGWIARALDCSYIVKRRMFWSLSLTHHLLWLVPFLLFWFNSLVKGKFNSNSSDLGLVLFLILIGYIFAATAISAVAISKDKVDKEGELAGTGQPM